MYIFLTGKYDSREVIMVVILLHSANAGEYHAVRHEVLVSAALVGQLMTSAG